MSKISELSNGGALLSTDDLIVVRSGGNVRAQLSSLNGIAIGGSTPAAGSFTTLQASTSLNVDGSVTADDLIKVQNAAGSAAAEVDIVSGGTWRIRSNPTSGTNSYGFDIVKGSAGTDVKMSIDSSGLVGVGTSSPQEQLHVYTTGHSRVEAESTTGVAAFKATNNQGSYAWYVDNSADAFHLFDFTDNAQRVTVDGDGRVAVGTSSPQAKLHSYTSGTGSIPTGQFNQTSDDNTALTLINANNSATYSAIKLETRETQAAGWMIANEFQSAFNGDLVFRSRNAGTTSNENFRIKSSGSIIFTGKPATSPIFEMINPDNEDTDTGRETSIRFSGHRSGGEDVVNAQISAHHDGGADDDKGMLFFYTNNGSGLNLASKIDSGGVAHFNGDVKVLSGDIQMGNGRGINFTPTGDGSGSMSSETLDDYEEGVWTPTLPSGGSLTAVAGTYTKIGRQVTVQFYVHHIAPTANNSGFQIGGLPYAGTSTSNVYHAGSIFYTGTSTGDATKYGMGVANGGNYIYFHFIDGSSGSAVSNNDWISNMGSGTGKHLIAAITYTS